METVSITLFMPKCSFLLQEISDVIYVWR